MKSKLDNMTDEEIQKAYDALEEEVISKEERKELNKARESGICNEKEHREVEIMLGWK